MDHDADAERLGDIVAASGPTVAVAESLTGGELSARLAGARGSGPWFLGGVVAATCATALRRLQDACERVAG